MKFIISLFTLIILISCNAQQQEEKSNNPITENNIINCYRYIKNNDTVMLKTISIGSDVTGILTYNFYEKDKSVGTILGKMKGELLVADYSFSSEGVHSVRQVVFKKIDRTFIEGYGEIEEQNGKTIFKNIDSLYFNNSILLKEIECQK
jgi:hypothetical protein